MPSVVPAVVEPLGFVVWLFEGSGFNSAKFLIGIRALHPKCKRRKGLLHHSQHDVHDLTALL